MSEMNLLKYISLLRRYHAGELQFDEHLRPVKVVFTHDGRIVGPVMVAMLEAANTVLFLPHAEEDAVEVQVTLEKFEEEGERGAFADRWRIYHGEPEDVNWAFYHIDAARIEGLIVDGDALTISNPINAEEAGLCKEVNEKARDTLSAACLKERNLNIEKPMLVGVDSLGLDVRGPFDIIRLDFPEQAENAEHAEKMLKEILG